TARAQDRQVQVQADRGGARQQAGADRLCARDQRRPLRRPSGRGLNEQAPQERGFAARRSASRATAKRCEPTERLGSPAKGRRHSERVLLIGRRAMRTNIRASGTFVSAPTGRRHDRTRRVRKASTKPLTTGRRPDMPFPVGARNGRNAPWSGPSLKGGRLARDFGPMWRLQEGGMSETRKLAAILVADVVGYSRLAGADEERTLAGLRGLRSDLIDPAIAAHHGRIVKRTGDGSIIEFRSAVDAVRCAIEIQNGLIERNAGVPEDRRIEFRVGIHVGDVVEESDGDLMGDGVNIAARLEGIAKPGPICLSEDAYRQVSGRLEMEVTDLGATQLKNIDRPIRAYSLQVGVPAKPKPATSANPSEPKRRSRLALFGAAIAALLFLVAAAAWYFLAANRPASIATKAPAEAARLSIVVLPFANLSGDPGQDYLADALTDELTTALARIRDTFVIARNTAMTFKGKPIDAKAIGKDLGVRYVLEGSVQPSGDRMRVNAQLIDAGSGAHLWAEQFDTPRADLLQTQDAIATHLARAMDLRLND